MPEKQTSADPAAPGHATSHSPDVTRGFGVGAVAGRILTPITYHPVAVQKQWQSNRDAIAGKPYAGFFTSDLQVPVAAAKALQHGPMPSELVLSPSVGDIAKLLADPDRFPDAGYALLEGPAAYAQARIEMASVTTEMFKWWFLWHPIEKERYMLWFPHAHIDNFVADPRRLADTSLTFEQRLYGNPNTVEEFIGPSALRIVIHFTDPTDLGLDALALRRAGFTTSCSGTIRIADAPNTTFMLMLHLARDTGRGMELFSRYWIGAHPAFDRFPGGRDASALLTRMGMDAGAIEKLAYEMAVHDLTEFNRLAAILPTLHGQFGQM